MVQLFLSYTIENSWKTNKQKIIYGICWAYGLAGAYKPMNYTDDFNFCLAPPIKPGLSIKKRGTIQCAILPSVICFILHSVSLPVPSLSKHY